MRNLLVCTSRAEGWNPSQIQFAGNRPRMVRLYRFLTCEFFASARIRFGRERDGYCRREEVMRDLAVSSSRAEGPNPTVGRRRSTLARIIGGGGAPACQRPLFRGPIC